MGIVFGAERYPWHAGTSDMTDNAKLLNLETDLAELARLAATGSIEDVRLFLNRLIRKHRNSSPELAASLEISIRDLRKRHGLGILRDTADAMDDESSRRATAEDGNGHR